jgi:hypothetical protein
MRIARPCPKCGADPIQHVIHWMCARCNLQWWDEEVGGENKIAAYSVGAGIRVYSVEIPKGCMLSLGSKEEV